MRYLIEENVLTAKTAGLIIDQDRLVCIKAAVKEFSKSGCTLNCREADRIPDRMSLEIDGLQTLIDGRVIWRRPDKVGVEFIWDDELVSENRREERFSVSIHALLSNRQGTQDTPCRITEASRSGCRIQSDFVDILHDEVLIKIRQMRLPIVGKIIWRNGTTAGIRLYWKAAKRNVVELDEHAQAEKLH